MKGGDSSFTTVWKLWLFAFKVMMIVFASSKGSLGCVEEERNALLELKAEFVSFSAGSDIVPSWNFSRSSDCCSWERVICSNNVSDANTTRVTQLWLNLIGLSYPSDRYLNASLFLPFKEIQLLDLSDNDISGFGGTLRLKKLKILHLDNNFNFNDIPKLDKLPSLKELYLPNTSAKNLHNLEGSKLEALNLEATSLIAADNSLSIIWGMTSLKILSIGSNDLKSSLPEGFCEFLNLEELDLSYNFFQGSLPLCLANMTSLRALDLSYNEFEGIIAPSLFSRLSSLEYISLSGNSFQGSISLGSFFNGSKLKVFELVDNLRFNIETENPLYSPSSQMKSFRISNCILNKPYDAIPSFLLQQYELRTLELSSCGVTAVFPSWFLENNTHLEFLMLSNNSFFGELGFNSNSSNLDLSILDVSSNHIGGSLPRNLASIFPSLTLLDISNNLVQGDVPSFRDMVYLARGDMSSNNLTGQLPRNFLMGCELLYFLRLSDNHISGQLLRAPANNSLSVLYLDNNQFTGDISTMLMNNSKLVILDIRGNSLTGVIPQLIGDVQSLEYLLLSHNFLKGPLPMSFCKLHLKFLDLSGNSFGPELPKCTNFSTVRYLHLQSTDLRGPFPNFLQRATSLVTLDLRGNSLSGSLPFWINLLSNLRILSVEGNNLEGVIPRQICELNSLSILDLSANIFSGVIPACLNNLTFGNRDTHVSSLSTLDNGGDPEFVRVYYEGKLSLGSFISTSFSSIRDFVEVNFLSKNRLEVYKGSVLEYMSGLDLSSNNLSGSIPPELGWLSEMHALNLSNNHLTGSIPSTFSNLKQIESLDLSNNKLEGEVPPQLAELYRLSIFNVSHNNLSGRTPDWKNQFSTFDKTCYEGNPLLCGPPLESCSSSSEQLPQSPTAAPPSSQYNNEMAFVDAFKWSFLLDRMWWHSSELWCSTSPVPIIGPWPSVAYLVFSLVGFFK